VNLPSKRWQPYWSLHFDVVKARVRSIVKGDAAFNPSPELPRLLH
jgi:hypothetical protein